MSTHPSGRAPDDRADATAADTVNDRRTRLETIGSDPDYRFTLANERTFLSWIRTSLALIAGGVAVVQLAPSLGQRWVRLVLGCVLIALAVMLAAASHRRWYLNERAMRLGHALRPTRLTVIVAYGVAVIAVAVFVVLLIAGA